MKEKISNWLKRVMICFLALFACAATGMGGRIAKANILVEKETNFKSSSAVIYVEVFQGNQRAVMNLNVMDLDTNTPLTNMQKPFVSWKMSGNVTGGSVVCQHTSGARSYLRGDAKEGVFVEKDRFVNLTLPFVVTKNPGYSVKIEKICKNKEGSFCMKKGEQEWTGNQNFSAKTVENLTTFFDLYKNTNAGAENAGIIGSELEGPHYQIFFTPASYSVIYNGNGATGGATQKQSCSYGNTYKTQNNGFERQYKASFLGNGGVVGEKEQVCKYRFKGWGKRADAVMPEYGQQTDFSNLTTTNGGVINLYALWENNGITFPTAIKEGYFFQGWSTDPDADAGADNLYQAGDVLMLAQNQTYYAVWDRKAKDTSYTISYYKQKEAGSTDYSVYKVVQKEGQVGEVITGELVTMTGYTMPSATSIQLQQEPTRNQINYYYNKAASAQTVTYYTNNSYLIDGYTYQVQIDEYGFSYYLDQSQVKHYCYMTTDGFFYEYEITADGSIRIIRILSESDTETTLHIADTLQINGKTYAVTEIAAGAFADNKVVQTVYIGAGIQKIGKNAFCNCKALKKVVFEGSEITSIGSRAFYNCKALENINLKKLTKLKKIPDYCFYGCRKLKNITIPKAVTNIGKKAFYGCKNLKKVNVKSTKLKKVSKSAFNNCAKKVRFVVPRSKVTEYESLF